MGTSPRKVRVRPAPGDVVEVTQGPDGSLHVTVRPTGNGKPTQESLRWTDKLRDVWEAIGLEGASRKAVMERAGYPNDSASDKMFRKLVRAGLAIEANGLVRRNPDATGPV